MAHLCLFTFAFAFSIIRRALARRRARPKIPETRCTTRPERRLSMKRFPLPTALLALAALITTAHILTMAQTQKNGTLAAGAEAPPVAKKIAHTTTVHG